MKRAAVSFRNAFVFLFCALTCAATASAPVKAVATPPKASPYVVVPAARFLFEVREAATSEPVALLRLDWRGPTIFDLSDDKPEVRKYLIETLKEYQTSSTSAGKKLFLPGTSVRTVDQLRSTSGTMAGAVQTTTSVFAGNMTPALTARLRKLIKEKGSLSTLREFAMRTIVNWVDKSKDQPDEYRISSSGSPYGIRHGFGRFIVPRVLAQEITSDTKFKPTMRVMLMGSCAARSSFPRKLSDLVQASVWARDDLFAVREFSDVDVFAYSDDEIVGMQRAADKGNAMAAYMLSRYFEAQVMKPKPRLGTATEARKWLEEAARLKSVPGMFDLAYVLTHEGPSDLARAADLLAELKKMPEYRSDESLKTDVDALLLDIADMKAKPAEQQTSATRATRKPDTHTTLTIPRG